MADIQPGSECDFVSVDVQTASDIIIWVHGLGDPDMSVLRNCQLLDLNRLLKRCWEDQDSDSTAIETDSGLLRARQSLPSSVAAGYPDGGYQADLSLL
ncbi:uncharacterized protein ANIA_11653 [Aspergillus nidulans FGSC A4]|uniref:Uncharacterized protein n=1 Tax=Emericella nidulans (strain FGSC A4 / ATCC 38163 / CBS 112.46 / NRRL 194 / M139) TaxID=227321 RepID=C8VQC4_EMENI|nr:hypothetical protein [Aspergillus nidulans FGSC A4]CBF87311.1 TPA: hypothetical protein ANIA_11653 [Aspergillus nidulans FGSC A4]